MRECGEEKEREREGGERRMDERWRQEVGWKVEEGGRMEGGGIR